MPLILLPDWNERKLGPDGSLCQSQLHLSSTRKKWDPSTVAVGGRSACYPAKKRLSFHLVCWRLQQSPITEYKSWISWEQLVPTKQFVTQLFFGFTAAIHFPLDNDRRMLYGDAAPSTWFIKVSPHAKAEEKHCDGPNTKLHWSVFHKLSNFPPGSVQRQTDIRSSCSRILTRGKPETQWHLDSPSLTEWADNGSVKLVHVESRTEMTGLFCRAAQRDQYQEKQKTAGYLSACSNNAELCGVQVLVAQIDWKNVC